MLLYSIITPVHNGGRYLSATLDSVLAQTHADWELLVIDDGSTDDTNAILARYAAEPRLRVLRQAQGGTARARNRGLAEARGELLAFLDADDVWERDYLARMAAALADASGATAAFTGWQSIDEAGQLLPQRLLPYDGDGARLAQEITWKNALMPSGVVARRAAVAAIGGFDDRLFSAEDWDLWLRLLKQGPFVGVPGYGLRYRQHPQSKTAQTERAARGRLAVMEKHFGPAPADLAQWPLARRQVTANIYLAWGLAHFAQNDIEPGIEQTRSAIGYWPGFLERPELYYELGTAFQPRGWRGAREGLRLDESTVLIRRLLHEAWPIPAPYNRQRLWGYACLVLSQLAYTAGDRGASRRLAATALAYAAGRHKPAALRRWLRAALPAPVISWARRLRRGPAPNA